MSSKPTGEGCESASSPGRRAFIAQGVIAGAGATMLAPTGAVAAHQGGGRALAHQERCVISAATAEAAADLVRRVFAAGDNRDMEGLLALLSSDCRYRFGNADPVYGHEGVRTLLSGRRTNIKRARHELICITAGYEGPLLVLNAECSVMYTLVDDSTVTLPCVTVMRRGADGLVTDYRIYMDARPVFG